MDVWTESEWTLHAYVHSQANIHTQCQRRDATIPWRALSVAKRLVKPAPSRVAYRFFKSVTHRAASSENARNSVYVVE